MAVHDEGSRPHDQARPHNPTRPLVRLFGRPEVVVDGESKVVPAGSQRLLAFVALHRVRVERGYVAGVLWPLVDDVRAIGNLRSALWRLRAAGIEAVVADKRSLMLEGGADVDVHVVAEWASRVIAGRTEAGDLDIASLPNDACELFSGWYDEWALLERERVRQRVLHALESLVVLLTDRGRLGEAIAVALRAVACGPLRESAQRVLLTAYLAQGDVGAARAAYAAFAELVRSELGVEPSRRIAAMLDQAGPGPSSRARYAGGSRPMSEASSSR